MLYRSGRFNAIDTFLSVVLLFALRSVAAQDYDQAFIKKEKLEPPGTSLLRDGAYMDETEITNIAWLEFLHYLAKDSSETYYRSMLPDTTVWDNSPLPELLVDKNIDSTSQTRKISPDNYLRYPGYRWWPVVGITFFQATEYCRWRSKAASLNVNERLAREKKRFRVEFQYILPDLNDLRVAASYNAKPASLDRKTKRLIRSITDDEISDQYFPGAIAQPIAKTRSGRAIFVPSVNLIGYIYANCNDGFYCNVIGNVSEMTSVEGISFGGAWIHTLDSIKAADYVFPYSGHSHWLGFRCAATMKIVPVQDK